MTANQNCKITVYKICIRLKPVGGKEMAEIDPLKLQQVTKFETFQKCRNFRFESSYWFWR